MNSKRKAPSIPLDRPVSWEDWLAGRRARRRASKEVAPGTIRRARSSSDRRLRRLFKGERGLPFPPDEQL